MGRKMDQLVYSLENSAIASWLKYSTFAYPVIESIHVIGIAVLVGTLLIVDLRLIGLELPGISIRQISKEALSLTWIGFALALVTGLVLFSEKAGFYLSNFEFLAKMSLILLAGVNMAIFEFITRKSINDWDTSDAPPITVKMAGILSLTFWFFVIVFGRLIGFANEVDPLSAF